VKKMKTFSSNWKSSRKRRKQRKYRYNAPLHIKRKFVSSHLSKELIQKHNTRNIQIVTGDKVKVLRGQFKGHTGKIEEVDIKKSRIFVSGIEIMKKDGSKTRYPINASNVIITELNLNDKKRNAALNRKNNKKV
jgi:large subunit ribosomal protein L24